MSRAALILCIAALLCVSEAASLRDRVRAEPAVAEPAAAEPAVAEPAAEKAAEKAAGDAPANGAEKPVWSYVGGKFKASECGTDDKPCGPEAWFKTPNNAKCELSVVGEQSPINLLSYPPTAVDLATAADELKTELSWTQIGKWKTVKPSFVNNGHTLQVNVDKDMSPDGNVEYAGNKYILRQFHFHAPSEHTVGTIHKDGHYMMEQHMVHTTADTPPKILAIGSFLEMADGGEDEAYFTAFWDKFPEGGAAPVEAELAIDVGGILEKLKGPYYSYRGSFTTPPCTEGVRWIIFQKTLKVSQKLRDDFLAKMPESVSKVAGNARPTQPLNLRTVYLVSP